MDHEMEALDSQEEPLLDESSRGGSEDENRVPWEPHSTEYLGSKVKYFRHLSKQDWVRVSPPTKSSKQQNMYPPPHVLPPAGILPHQYLLFFT